MNKVFLGGTCNNDNWRNLVMKELKKLKYDFFNPVVKEWKPEDLEIENNEKENECDIHLYCITSKMTGVYSIAELIESCFNKEKIVIYIVLEDDFEESQIKSLKAVNTILEKHSENSKFSCIPRKDLVKEIKSIMFKLSEDKIQENLKTLDSFFLSNKNI
jgi:hypothetical protein